MKIDEIMKFAELYGKFKLGKHGLNDVATLTDYVWQGTYSDEAKRTLLQIPLKTLEIVELTMPASEFAKNNSSYFAGNCVGMPNWKTFYEARQFDLNDVRRHLEEIIANSPDDAYAPRIAEVTIRDDVRVTYIYDFKDFGPMFAYVLEKAFEL